MKYIFIAGIAILIVFLIVLSFIPLGIEPLTELYFENHVNLSKDILLNKPYDFSFSVHNLEYMDMDYSYNVTAEYSDKIISLDSGNFMLENNETKTIDENFSIKEEFERARINVELKKLIENPMQKDPNLKNITTNIHFWVDEV